MGAGAQPPGDGLLERDVEARALMGAVDHAAVGRGGARIVQGPAGIGKSALLAAATEYGRARGLRVVAVQASELESGVAFGVARQLLSAAALRAATATATPPGDSSDPVAPVATLHAAVAEAAGAAPLLLCVDDLQWADAASLRFIAFHARRLGELPVALLLGLRTPLRSPAPRALADLLNAARDRVLRPDPLSPAASAALVRGNWSTEVGDALCAACHEATGGNPFLLTELVAALRQAGVAPTALAIPDALAIGARAVGPLVLARLERVPPAASAFACAAAVAAEVGSASLVAHLAGIEESAGEAALAALTAANVCAPGEGVRFAHPLVRMAIRDGMAPAERTRLARAAADALAAAGDRDAAAAFLLALPTAGDAAVAAALGDAGLRARRDGAPDVAATLLARALDEPPADALRPELLLALGDARRLLGDPAALVTLRDARELAEDPRRRAESARSLALALLAQLRVAEAVALLDEAVAEAAAEGETALAEELEVLAANHAFWDPAALASRAAGGESPAPARPVASPRAGRARRVLRALDAVAACRPAAEAAELAEQGLASGELMVWEPALHCAGALVLTACGLTSAARVQLSALAAHAAAAGDMQAVRSARVLRAAATLADGDVVAAELDARAALADADVLDGGGALLFPLLEVLLRQGRAEEAVTLLREHGLLEPLPPVTPFNTILHARGRVLIATGSARAGLEDVLLAGTRQEAVGHRNPALIEWRASAVAALLDLGEVREARRIAHENLALARRFGAPASLGQALRTAAAAADGDEARALLREAVALLDGTHARGELARAQLALGELLDRDGERAAARSSLTAAMRLAEQLGDSVLAARATAATVAAGGRPRRRRGAGAIAELTRAEQRVAELARDGASNAEIAQVLVVSLKTVETHLSRVYRKLGIGARAQLGAALAAEPLSERSGERSGSARV